MHLHFTPYLPLFRSSLCHNKFFTFTFHTITNHIDMASNNIAPYYFTASGIYGPYYYTASGPVYGPNYQTPQAQSDLDNGPARVPRPASQHYQTAASGLHGISTGARVAAEAMLELARLEERPAAEGPMRVETPRARGAHTRSESSDGASSSTLRGTPAVGEKRNASDGDEAAPSQPAKRRRRQAPARKPAAGKIQELEAAIAPQPQPKESAKAQSKGTKRKLEAANLDENEEQQAAAIALEKGPLPAKKGAAAEGTDNGASGSQAAKKAKTKKQPVRKPAAPVLTCEVSGRQYTDVYKESEITTANWIAKSVAYQYPTPPTTRVPSFDSQASENDPAVPVAALASHDPARITRTLAALDHSHSRKYKDSAETQRKFKKAKFVRSKPPVLDEVDRPDDPAFYSWRAFEKLHQPEAPAGSPAPAPASEPAPAPAAAAEGEPREDGEPKEVESKGKSKEEEPKGEEEEEEEETKRCDPKDFAALWNVPYKYDMRILLDHELEHGAIYRKMRDDHERQRRAEYEAEQRREQEEREKKEKREKEGEGEEKRTNGEPCKRERKKSRRQLEMEEDAGAKRK